MFRVLLISLLTFFVYFSAEAQTISGVTNPQMGVQYEYSISGYGFRPNWDPGSYGTVHSSWASGGTNYAMVSWSATGSRTLTYRSNGSVIATKNVTVTLPTLNPGQIGNAQNLCGGSDPATLTNVYSASGGSGTLNYQWQRSNSKTSWQNISGATGSTYNPPSGTVTWDYRRRVQDNYSTKYTNTVRVTMYNVVAGSISGAQTLCYNGNPSTISNSQSASGGNGSYSYQWQISSNNSSWSNISGATGTTYNPPNLTSTKYYRRRVTSAGCGYKYTSSVKITIYGNLSAGSIGNAQTVCYNGNPSTLTNTGSPSGGTGSYTYQWQISSNNSTWSNISGATGSTYNPPNLTSSKWYRRRVTSGSCGTKYTSSVKVTVRSAVSGGSIGNAQTLCYNGNPGTLTNTGNPSGGTGSFTYQWQISSNGSSGWSNISGATSSTYNPPNLTSSKWYRRRATSSGGCGSAYSNTVKVTIYGNLSAGSIGNAQTVCYNGNPGTITNTASPSGGTGSYAYQWQISSNGSSGWSNISGATSSTYNPPNLTSSRWYRRRVISGSCGTRYTNTIKITVRSPVSAGSIGGTQTVCYNGNPSVLTNATSPSGGTGSFTYQWQISSNNSTWSDISGATSSTYDPPSLTSNRWYRRRATSSGGCGSATTSSVKVTVRAQVNGGSIGNAQDLCWGNDPSTLTNVSSPTGGTGSYSYQWQSSPDNSTWSNISGATSSTYNPPELYIDTYYKRIATSTGGCGSDDSNSILITVGPRVNPGEIGGGGTICYGSTPGSIFNVTAASGGMGNFSYQWQISTDDTNWSDIAGATALNYNTSPGLTTTTYFRRKVTSGTCNDRFTSSVQVIVYDDLSAGTIGNAQTICHNGDPSAISNVASPTGGTGSYTYQWQESTNNTNWFDITGATSVTYNPPSMTYNKYFRRNVTSGSCGTVNSASVLITVRDEVNGGSIGNAQDLCWGNDAAALTNVGSPSGGTGTFTYQWMSSTDNINFTDVVGATGITYDPPELYITSYFKRISTSSGGCGSEESNVIEITVGTKLNAGNIGGDKSICYNTTPGSIFNIDGASGGMGNYTYQWEISTDDTNWSDIIGATAANYNISPALTTTTYFRRTAMSGSCNERHTSSVQIIVYDDLSPGSVGGTQTVCYDGDPSTLPNTGSPSGGTGSYTYQWQESTNDVNWFDITGATGATYNPPSMTYNKYFRRNVTSESCGTVSTASILVTVRDELKGGTIGNAQDLCWGNDAAALTNVLSPSGGAAPLTYQWQSSTDNITFTNITGANSLSYDPAELYVDTYYKRITTSGASCGSAESNVILISVGTKLNAGTIGGEKTICYGDTPGSITNTGLPSGGMGGYTYRWQKSTDDLTWDYIDGADDPQYNISPALYTDTYFRREVSSGTCNPRFSSSVLITVRDDLDPGTISSAQNICYDTQAAELGIATPPGGGTGVYSYQWQVSVSGSEFQDIVGETNSTFTPPTLTSDREYRLNVTSESCGTKPTNAVLIDVEAQVQPGSIGNAHTKCWADPAQTITNVTGPTGGGGAPFTYRWEYMNQDTTWTEILGETGATLDPPMTTLTTSFRRFAISSLTCESSASNVIEVISLPKFVAGSISGAQTINYGADPDLINSDAPATGGEGTPSYQWEYSEDNVNWADVTNVTSQASWLNPTTLKKTTWFRRRAVAGICGPSYTTPVEITVLEPSIFFTSPMVNSTWVQASTLNITYTSTIDPSVPLTFSLVRGVTEPQPGQYLAEDQYAITSLPNWTIPAAARIASDYQILVDFDGQQLISPAFTIFDDNVYALIEPLHDAVLEIGNTYDIVWEDKYGIPFNYNVSYAISGDPNTTPIYNGILGTPVGPNLTTQWTVPPLQAGYYDIIVEEEDGLIYFEGRVQIDIPFCFQNSTNASTGVNYVKTYTARDPFTDCLSTQGDSSVVKESITYVDGLGRPIQQIALNASPSGYDWVTGMQYDGFGRRAQEFLPYPDQGTEGLYRDLWTTGQQDYIENRYDLADRNYGFSEQIFEESPLNRPIQTASPGVVWSKDSIHMVETEYIIFDGSEVIKNLSVNGDQVVIGTDFAAGELSITRTKDENNGTDEGIVEEFTNSSGQVVVKKVRLEGIEYAYTYYIYDERNNLSFVVQPEGVDRINADVTNGWNLANDDTFRSNWMFCYDYDHRNRMIAKRVPGSDWVYMVYDHRDRLVLTQAGNQRNVQTLSGSNTMSEYQGKSYAVESGGSVKLLPGFQFTASSEKGFFIKPSSSEVTNDWIFTKYDNINRPVMTGKVALPAADDQHIEVANFYTTNGDVVAKEAFVSTASGSLEGYTNQSFPTNVTEADLLSVTYYDDYGFNLDDLGTEVNTPPANAMTPAKGQTTGSRVRILGTTDMLTTTTWYDDRYRVIESVTDNHIGGTDVVNNTYYSDVSPLVTQSTRTHTSDNITGNLQIIESYEYDHMDRVEKVTHNIDGQGDVDLLTNVYDESGQLISKGLHNGTAQTVDYDYNIRGWMTTINGGTNLIGTDVFGMELKYDAAGQFNGNIGQIDWKTLGGDASSNQNLQTYTYAYDASNRIKSADYFSTGLDDHFDVNGINYDKNGNILFLNRKKNNVLIDVLDYDYENGNQLSRVEDTGTQDGFEDVDNVVGTDEYTYDDNGNMIADVNKGISSINYNYLNLPELVSFDNGDEVRYLYDAGGTKLQKVNTVGSNTESTQYVSGVHYKDGSLSFVLNSEGQIRFISSLWAYEYNLVDHLDNTRTSVTSSGDVLQREDYYPFGFTFGNYVSGEPNHYTYNGKEFESQLGVLDYDARRFDPILGRWHQLDPLAEKYYSFSPNTYAANNPLSFIDPTGGDLVRIGVPSKDGVKYIAVDSKIAQQAYDFAWQMYAEYGAYVTEAYRTDAEQKNMRGVGTKLVAKVGKSRHQQGFALDFGVNAAFYRKYGKGATDAQKKMAGAFGKENGWSWQYELRDYPHFELDALDYGYSSREEAYKINKKFFNDQGGRDGIPIVDLSAGLAEAIQHAEKFMEYHSKENRELQFDLMVTIDQLLESGYTPENYMEYYKKIGEMLENSNAEYERHKRVYEALTRQ